MVLKECNSSEAKLVLLLAHIRSEVRLQVAQFPGSRPHRVHPQKQEHGGRRDKKKMF